jgi:hypothetical protein
MMVCNPVWDSTEITLPLLPTWEAITVKPSTSFVPKSTKNISWFRWFALLTLLIVELDLKKRVIINWRQYLRKKSHYLADLSFESPAFFNKKATVTSGRSLTNDLRFVVVALSVTARFKS